ncbi:MAG: IPT/TIG domain-containing protein, partial [Ilumatobacteraceae bacterium]
MSNVAVFAAHAKANPTVTAITPNSGLPTGGTAVAITGTGFLAGATVTIGGAPATSVVVVSATTITAATPAGTGTGDVVVTNILELLSGKLKKGFTYSSAPTVKSISPVSGPAAGGTSVTVDGKDFVAGATVTIGGVAATSVTVSAKSITAVTSAHVAGVVNVVVKNPDTQFATLTGKFTYRAAPTVTSISPVSGPVAGGTSVTIEGKDFVVGAKVTIGGAAATSVAVSAKSITAVTSAHVAGVVNVVVKNTDTQFATLTGKFTYRAAPTLTSISPVSGPAGG